MDLKLSKSLNPKLPSDLAMLIVLQKFQCIFLTFSCCPRQNFCNNLLIFLRRLRGSLKTPILHADSACTIVLIKFLYPPVRDFTSKLLILCLILSNLLLNKLTWDLSIRVGKPRYLSIEFVYLRPTMLNNFLIEKFLLNFIEVISWFKLWIEAILIDGLNYN